ncbi:interleukin-5 [Tupaia chinensis]|uniref:interleukin-5 n=1 Tax=Tupaia chinensis TaxID=246437 RepID=UPI0003C8FB40|nr:interleukin-5 [Tupaia chinensis]
MRMLLQLGFLALGVAYIHGFAIGSSMSTVVAETLALLSTHRTLLTGNESLRIPVPAHKNHQLCTEEIFQGIDTLKNQTVQGDAVEKLFRNLSLLKNYIDDQKKKCGEERRRVKQFLEYLQEFLGVINTEWTMES